MMNENKAYNYQNEHAYEYTESEWDIIPPTYGKKSNGAKPRLLENVQVIEKIHPETLKKRRKAIGLCSMILVCFLLMSGVVYSYAMLSKVNLKTNEHVNHIKELTAQVEELEVDIAGARNISEVQKKAKELGMDFATSSQIEYVNLNTVG